MKVAGRERQYLLRLGKKALAHYKIEFIRAFHEKAGILTSFLRGFAHERGKFIERIFIPVKGELSG